MISCTLTITTIKELKKNESIKSNFVSDGFYEMVHILLGISSELACRRLVKFVCLLYTGRKSMQHKVLVVLEILKFARGKFFLEYSRFVGENNSKN